MNTRRQNEEESVVWRQSNILAEHIASIFRGGLLSRPSEAHQKQEGTSVAFLFNLFFNRDDSDDTFL
jgi:hypothetical protein